MSTDWSSITTGTGSVSTNTTSSAAASVANAASSYTTFMTLLTTQLQHQDPLDPTNTDTFTSEMIQLSGVEQQLETNNKLADVQTQLSTITAANGLGYIGKTVTATGSTLPLQSGSAEWNYTLNSAAHDVTLNVVDSSGQTVYSTTGDTSSGAHDFTWDGKTSSGSTLSSGDYTLKVVANDASGDAVTTSTAIIGKVTGVDTTNGTVSLKIGDVDVAMTDVTTLNS